MKTTSAFLLAASLLGCAGVLAYHAGATEPSLPNEAETLKATTFAQYQKQIKPQSGESRWMEVPWFLDLHEARELAFALWDLKISHTNLFWN